MMERAATTRTSMEVLEEMLFHSLATADYIITHAPWYPPFRILYSISHSLGFRTHFMQRIGH